MTISEKVAHLRGVIEGMNFDTETNEGKIISLVVDILDDIAIEVDEIEEDVNTLFDYADELDEDLGAVEADLYDDGLLDGMDCCDCDCDCDDDDCDCGCHDDENCCCDD